MTLEERMNCLVALGEVLSNASSDSEIQTAFTHAEFHNKWFTQENIASATKAIQNQFTDQGKLEKWLSAYHIANQKKDCNVGLVLAGNIPYVGIHDVICTFLAGHNSHLKFSDKDSKLIPMVINQLIKIDPRAKDRFVEVDRMNSVDAIIATGSNNSSRYFEYYFKDKPHIIRKNRVSVAILHGNESREDLLELGKDIFSYFGLGCRNVSKLYLPRTMKVEQLLEAFEDFDNLVDHHKYKNNYDYNYAIYLLNKDPFLANNSVIAKEDKSLYSRIACFHYEYYDKLEDILPELSELKNEIQCYISDRTLEQFKTHPLGKSQEPELWDYADNIDTMQFLLNLTHES